MPTYYFCDQHKKVFETKQQMTGHWNFNHPGEERPEDEALQTNEKIEGYEFQADRRDERAAERAKARLEVKEEATVPEEVDPDEPREPREPRESKATRRTATRTVQPEALPLDGDALKLQKMLRAFGVSETDVKTIINGFIEIPYFREDPNALHRWLDTHITTAKLKMYIPLAVNEVFAASAQTPFIVNNRGSMSADGAPQYNFTKRQDAQPNYNYYGGNAADPEVTKRIETLQSQVGTLAKVIQEEREERERERREREVKEREAATNARMDKIEALIIAGNKPTEHTKDDRVDALLEELKQLRLEQQDQRFEVLAKGQEKLESLITNAKNDTVGKTAEDLVAGAIPVVMDKVDKMGERISSELKGVREQMGPTVKERLAEVTTPKTIEEIAETGSAENEFLNAYNLEDAPEATTEPVEAEPVGQGEATEEQEDPALARMPSRRS